MTEQAVDRQAMKVAADDVDASAQQLNTIRGDLGTQVATLMNGWEGHAARAFLRGYRSFDDGFGQVHKSLQELHGKLVETHTNYVKTEQQNTDLVSDIDSVVNASPSM